MKVAKGIFGSKIHYADNSYAALTGADALAIVTEWNEFREPDFARMRKLMRAPVIFDGRNIYNPESLRALGFTYISMGRSVSAVLVTGGAGYIGSHAVKALRARGETVIVYDNLQPGPPRGRPGTRRAVVEGDIQDTAKLDATLETHGVDAVMHFAAWLSVGDSVKDPAGYYRNNVGGALSVLEAMVASGVRHLVFSSTCAVFGTPDTTPIHEDLPKRPINAYGETKLAIEHALPHFEQAYGLRSVALRYFNAAGADPDGELGEDHSPGDPRHSARARRRHGARLVPVSSATTIRRRMAHACATTCTSTIWPSAHLLALDALRGGAPSNAYNLGNGRPTSVRDVLESVERVTGKRACRIELAPRRDGDPAALFASSDRARRELGWRPRLRGSRRHRRDRVALARRASARLRAR